MGNYINKRELVSFDGLCTFNCKHCYTYELPQNKPRSVRQIVDSLAGKNFDIVYVSQKRENFIVPEEGIELCETLFEKYNCNIIAITRNVFNEKELERLSKLNKKMRKNKKYLFLAVSIPALESYSKTEDCNIIPTPKKRIEFLKKLYDLDIFSILTIRPLYPNKIIPISEALEIINLCENKISCVLSSGLATNEHILNRIGLLENDFNYIEGQSSEYLVDSGSDVNYTDVIKEIKEIKEKCKEKNIPFFEHSMPAINYIIENMLIKV